MILDTVNRKLQVVLDAANTSADSPVHIDYVDITTTTLTPGFNPTLTNGTTVTDILDAPAASTQRKVNNLTLINKDTGQIAPTVIYYDNGTSYPIITCILQIDEVLAYTDTDGWSVRSASGARKVETLSPPVGLITVTADYAATSLDRTILADATAASGTLTVTLPATPNHGDTKVIKKIDVSTNTVTIDGNGNNIDGTATKLIIGQFVSYEIQYDSVSSAWSFVVAFNMIPGSYIFLNPLTLNTQTTQAHGLASNPDYVQTLLICLTAEYGYSVNDIIYNLAPTDAEVTSDTTNITFITNVTAPLIRPKGGGVSVYATAANWALFAAPMAWQ